MRGILTKEMSIDIAISILLFVISFSIYSTFVAEHVGGDGVSMYYPARQLIESNNLNMWDSYNDQYNTYYFKFPFTDEVIVGWGRSYPVQSVMTIFVEAVPIFLFGDAGFFYLNPVLGGLIAVVCYFTARELGCKRLSSSIASVLIFSMPVFVFWSIVPQNIIPSTFFLIVSVCFMLRYGRTGSRADVLLAGMAFGVSVAIRMPNAILILAFIAFFYTRSNRLRLDVKTILLFVFPIVILAMTVLALNQTYFGDALFQGYLYSDYHPVPPSEGLSGTEGLLSGKLLAVNFSLSNFAETVWDVFAGSTWIYCPLFIIYLFSIATGPKEVARFKFFALISIAVAIVYYSQISPLLFRPQDAGLKYSLSVTLFRYLIPIFAIAGLGGSLLIDRYLRRVERLNGSKSWKMVGVVAVALLLVTSVSSVSIAYTYGGGASLKWYEELNSKIEAYSGSLDDKLQSGAVILYDSRWPFEMVYPNVTSYHWFFYDGIPPDYRLNHTRDIVMSLLDDERTVYFVHFGPPYDELSKDVEQHLNLSFLLSPVEGTSLPRLNAEFYSVHPLTEGG